MPINPRKQSGPQRHRSDLALQITVGIIVVLSALLVGGLLTSLMYQ